MTRAHTLRGTLQCLLLACAMGLTSFTAFAGRSCEEAPVHTATVANALTLATQVENLLNEKQAEVVLIGRAGQNLTRWGVYYSHFGFAWRDHPKGRWTVVHQLNRCGTDRSDIFDEGLGNFFLDDLWPDFGKDALERAIDEFRRRDRRYGGLARDE